MAEKVTTMEIKTDLQCCRCYKKIKKVLCKFPEIRDQKYDAKNNTVIITVVSWCPEKIKQKICCKGGKSIKCIKIKEPPPPPPPAPAPAPAPTPAPAPAPAPAPTTKPKPKPVPVVCPPHPCYVVGWPMYCTKCYKGHPGDPCSCGQGRPPSPCHNVGRPICCRECSEGSLGGPCSCGKVRPPPRCYEEYRKAVYVNWGNGYPRGYYASRCDYFCEENPYDCTIM